MTQQTIAELKQQLEAAKANEDRAWKESEAKKNEWSLALALRNSLETIIKHAEQPQPEPTAAIPSTVTPPTEASAN